MANYILQFVTFQPTAVADATNLTDGGYMALQGGAATQVNLIDEVYMGGQAASTAPLYMLLARDSTVGATLSLSTNATNGPTTPGNTLSTVPGAFTIATTKPQRAASASFARMNFTFNAFGGIVRANYAHSSDRMAIVGLSANTGEVSLTAFTGSTASTSIGAHIIYETI